MKFISENNLAALLGTSAATTHNWAKKGIFPSYTNSKGIKGFNMEDLGQFTEVKDMLNSNWDEEFNVTPVRRFTSVELFAGGGGLALGMEKAGFNHILLNEFEKSACDTLRTNRPQWNIIEGDIRHIDFTPLKDKVDFLSGGFPCQAFSYAGKQGGFEDTRGTLFFELARAVKEIQPKVFMCENVKGLVSHDNGKTFKTICNAISELGYTLVEPKVLKGIMYQVPQKRERIILIAIKKEYVTQIKFKWPSPYKEVLTLRDALYKSVIYEEDVPQSEGASYPIKKKSVLSLVPEGGDWRDLPEEIAKVYMGGSWLLGGGKTGMARRLSLDEPSLTLTCSPCQKQTERCHPIETRPLSVREYARIQTFPDNWLFQGTMTDKYKQIGNAVPVNLAWAIGRSLIRLFNDIEKFFPSEPKDCSYAVKTIMNEQSQLVQIKDRSSQTSTVKFKQLNLFELFEEYEYEPIVENSLNDSIPEYENDKNTSFLCKLGNMKTLVGLVKVDNEISFKNKTATLYYTGKKFPSTIELKSLQLFIPFIKANGVRDVYFIKKIRVGKYKEGTVDERNNDFRLIFELEFIDSLNQGYKKFHLDIWKTFSLTTLNNLSNI